MTTSTKSTSKLSLMDLVFTCQDSATNVLSGVKQEVEDVLAGL